MSDNFVHVVVGLVQKDKQILIAKRPREKHQGGLWEFPGGKLEAGESPFSALSRELKEEVGIDIHSADSFLKIYHHYPDKSVFLDIYSIEKFSGQARGQEGQIVKWIAKDELYTYDFPAANQKILKALFVPEQIAITPETITKAFDFSEGVKQALKLKNSAILLRAPKLDDTDYLACAQSFALAIKHLGANEKLKLLVNRAFVLEEDLAVDGLHLSSQTLLTSQDSLPEQIKTIERSLLLSASCHNERELTQAQKLACDFVFLSPLKATESHPKAKPLGWQAAQALIEKVEVPVLLLGGLGPEDSGQSKDCGALGVAGISRFGLQQ